MNIGWKATQRFVVVKCPWSSSAGGQCEESVSECRSILRDGYRTGSGRVSLPGDGTREVEAVQQDLMAQRELSHGRNTKRSRVGLGVKG